MRFFLRTVYFFACVGVVFVCLNVPAYMKYPHCSSFQFFAHSLPAWVSTILYCAQKETHIFMSLILCNI